MYGTKLPLNNEEFEAALKQGVKFDADKPRTDLLSPIALIKISEVLTYGANKYTDNNWRKGMYWSRCLGACLRHLFAYLGGQDNDPETGLSHLAHAGCCIMFLLEYEETRREYDDRYRSSPDAGTVCGIDAGNDKRGD
jgi:hypothetical protein